MGGIEQPRETDLTYLAGVEHARKVENGYLLRYRLLAFTTAILLIVLVFVGIPLQALAGDPGVVNVVGTTHGFLYLVYLIVAFQLSRRLSIPKWQVLLVLLAGTVPFCAFIAERKLTRRYEALASPGDQAIGASGIQRRMVQRAQARQRWLSRRALLLHLEVLLIAPGCVAAGWWQATRALAGNGLSWFYSVEWPVFAVLAVLGWWRLIHEDPETYRARKEPSPAQGLRSHGASASLGAKPVLTVDGKTAHIAIGLAAGVGVEFLLGVTTLFLVRPGRPSGVLPAQWPVVYLVHAILGLPLALGAVVLLGRVRNAPRISRLSGWVGIVGVGVAGIGGLLTVPHNLRLVGMVIMFLGTVIALFAFLFPTLEKLDERR